MIANQKMKGNNGYENLLFPLDYLRVTQGEHSSTYYAMDFSGWGESGKIYQCPYYAPCSCTAKYVSSSVDNPYVIWQSDDKVNFIDGTIDYICILVGHDDNIADFKVGDTRSQGDLLGHTGNLGLSSGDHLHMYIGRGQWGKECKWVNTGTSAEPIWRFSTQYHIYKAMGINDTNIVNTGGYNWQEFTNDVKPNKPNIIPLSLVNALKWSI